MQVQLLQISSLLKLTSNIVYRGQILSRNEFNRLKSSIGDYISINSFLSTSLSEIQAFGFIAGGLPDEEIDDFLSCLFVIHIDHSSTKFANITNSSHFPGEGEVLFTIGTIFRVQNVYIDHDQGKVDLMLCRDDDYKYKQVLDYMENDIGGEKESLSAIARLLRKMGDYDTSEAFYQRLLDTVSSSHNISLLANCYTGLGVIAFSEDNYLLALEYHNQALAIRLADLSNHVGIGNNYHSLGAIHGKMHHYEVAIEYYIKALKLWSKSFPDYNHLMFAWSYGRIGQIYRMKKQCDTALNYLEKALQIMMQILPHYHPDTSWIYFNLGLVYHDKGEYTMALSNYKRALTVAAKTLPTNHLHLVRVYRCLGLVYECIENYKLSLFNYEQASVLINQQKPEKFQDRLELQYHI
ncbi:unnamed protein product [Didymodactylos carnosus]|uniref:Tetratricopeptide repeat protein n=1 Tax=Didymodactylos carnosus TaxID=1234261 RepID=A0A8S2S8Q3_9BILA|nr:unnamed protein product [Didymodactylos carnosus]CAF4216572.1 unnamed protein product [Didymodactylos carnosus]